MKHQLFCFGAVPSISVFLQCCMFLDTSFCEKKEVVNFSSLPSVISGHSHCSVKMLLFPLWFRDVSIAV